MLFKIHSHKVEVNYPKRAQLLGEVSARLKAGKGFSLATLNLDHLVKMRRDPAFVQAYCAQDMVVADGNPIVWLSLLQGRPVELMPGSDLVLPLAQIAAWHGVPVALVGSSPESLSKAAADLVGRVPGLKLARQISPSMGFDPNGDEARAILQEIADLGPVLCLLALGAPKQETLAALGRQIAPQAGFACFGAGLDFLSGKQVRAPLVMRRFALEWLWRVWQAPGRMLPRYAACAAILPGQFLYALRHRGQA